MKPNSEYTLTKLDNLQLQEDIINVENKKHRVELFLNNEYKGVYILGYLDEKNPNNDNVIKFKK